LKIKNLVNQKLQIKKFLIEKPDEIFAITELKKELNIKQLDTRKMVRLFDDEEWTLKINRSRYFGCPEAIKKAKKILLENY